MVCGVGYDRGDPAPPVRELRVVVTNLAVLDFATAGARRCGCVRSIRACRSRTSLAATGFPLAVPDQVPVTRTPTAAETGLIRGPGSTPAGPGTGSCR